MSSRSLLRAARALAALGLVALSLTGEIAIHFLLIGGVTWAISFLIDRNPPIQKRFRSSEWMAAVGIIVWTVCDFLILKSTLFVTVAHFLLLFQSLKMLCLKERRDGLQIILIAFFQILASCALSVDVTEGLVLMVFIPLATAALFWHHIELEGERAGKSPTPDDARHFRRVAVGMSITAMPVILFLTASVFILFPRLTLNASLPGFGNPISGFSNQVNLSQTGSLQDAPTPVLWLEFASPEARAIWNGYLRGGTLERFDGRGWVPERRGGQVTYATPFNNLFHFRNRMMPGQLLRTSITLVNTGAATLFVPGRPIEVSAPLARLEQDSDGTIHWTQSWHKPLHYDAVSVQNDLTGNEPPVYPDDVALPSGGSGFERVAALARSVAGNGSAGERARRVEAYLRKNYTYSLDLGQRAEKNPVDHFLFVSRRGPCTYFASAMAVMLRLVDVPCRLASGYLQGEWNAPAGQYLIRERDAHAWVEVYVQGSGWQTFDPSPRIRSPVSPFKRWTYVLQYIDFLQLKWERLVIQYDLYSQIRTFQSVKNSTDALNAALTGWWMHHRPHAVAESDSPELSDQSSHHAKLFGLSLALMSLAGVALFLFNRRTMKISTHPDIASYQHFLRDMARSGYPKAQSETGAEFAARLAQVSSHATVAQGVTKRYYDARFAKLSFLLIASLTFTTAFSRVWADDSSDNVSSLIHALKSSDPDQAEHAAEALKKLGPAAKDAVPALRHTLTNDMPYVRIKSAEALASIGAPAIQALIEGLKNDSSDVRSISAGALGSLGQDAAPAAGPLAHMLEDSDFTVRASAASALQKIGSAAVPAILPLCKSDSSQTRMAAIRALSEIRSPDESVAVALLAALKDDDVQVRLTAVKAMGRIGKPVVATLTRDGLTSADASVRAQVCGVLGDIGRGSADAVPGLIEALKDSDKNVQASAATALGKIGGPARPAVPALRTLAQNTDPILAAKAQDALTNLTALFGGEKHDNQMTPSTPFSPSAPAEVTRPVKRVKGHWKPKSVVLKKEPAKKKIDPSVAKWIKQLGNDDDVERLEASQSLVHAGPKAVDGLIESVHKSTEPVRVVSCTILGKIGPSASEAIPTLTETLQDVNPDLQQSAAMALVEIDTTTAFKILGEMALSDPDITHRVLAITTMGLAGPQAAPLVPLLTEVLKDSNTALSDRAALSLSQINTPDAGKAVKQYEHLQTMRAVQTAVRELRANTTDIDPRAVEELTKIGAPGVVPMAQNLKDASPHVRGGVARALNRLGRDATPATGALAAALDDDDSTVRHEAAESLAKIDTQEANSALRFFSIKDWYKSEMRRFRH